MKTNQNENSPGRSAISLVSKTWCQSILTFSNVQKLIAEPGYLSVILRIRQNKHNLFRNFSQSVLFSGIKLAPKFTWIHKIVNIIKIIGYALQLNSYKLVSLLMVVTIVLFTNIVRNCSSFLPSGISQLVFPSPTYPALQAQLYEPAVFVQEERLGRQSWEPWLHSSTTETMNTN